MWDRRSLLAAGAATTTGCAVGSVSANPGVAPEHQANLGRFAVNLEMWWHGRPFADRIDQAAYHGFDKVELWTLGSGEKQPADLARRARDAGVAIVHFVGAIPQMVTTSTDLFEAQCRTIADTAATLGARKVTLTGYGGASHLTREAVVAALAERLARVESLFREAGLTAMLEPLNPHDHPGQCLYGSADALAVCRAVSSRHIRLNWDFYHMQRSEGNLLDNFMKAHGECGYVQIADPPSRHEPGLGEVNFVNVLRTVVAAGLGDDIGLECYPANGEDVAIKRVRDLVRAVEKNGNLP
jgi:hydroxypyruvate isomerase